jgi:hypothetical protein
MSNGELLTVAESNGFDVLITNDKSIYSSKICVGVSSLLSSFQPTCIASS